jgi:hypothetical protein
MKILIFKQRASYKNFQAKPIVDEVIADGYSVLIYRVSGDDRGYFGRDDLMYYVEFECDEDMIAFKLRYL